MSVLVIAWVLLFLIALMEFMNENRKIRKLLMYKEPWRPKRPCIGSRKNTTGGQGNNDTDEEKRVESQSRNFSRRGLSETRR